jgi:pimeloyl-ACP methyl ester carboxylesterase
MELLGLGWPPPPLARLGWLTAGRRNPDPANALGMAFLLRGQGVIFSRGIGRMCGRLRAAGVWAEDLRCVGDRWACRRALAERGRGRASLPLVLVGHSRGGRRALAAAWRLSRRGVEVALLVCLDTALPPPVPANVRRAVHLFLGRPRLYPARPLQPAAGSAGQVYNLRPGEPGAPALGRGVHHLNLTACPEVQDWVVGQVLEACSGARR